MPQRAPFYLLTLFALPLPLVLAMRCVQPVFRHLSSLLHDIYVNNWRLELQIVSLAYLLLEIPDVAARRSLDE